MSRAAFTQHITDLTRVGIHRRTMDYIQAIGATKRGWLAWEQGHDVYAHVTNTVLGVALIEPHLGWINVVFCEPARARSVLGDRVKLDGRMSFHPYPGQTADQLLESFIAVMDHIIPAVITTRDNHHWMTGDALASAKAAEKPLDPVDQISQAMEQGQPLNVLYSGGSEPGTWRLLTPTLWKTEGELFEAVDQKTMSIKAYRVVRVLEVKPVP